MQFCRGRKGRAVHDFHDSAPAWRPLGKLRSKGEGSQLLLVERTLPGLALVGAPGLSPTSLSAGYSRNIGNAPRQPLLDLARKQQRRHPSE